MPIRYVGEPYKEEGRWYAKGKTSAVVIADAIDTSRVYFGRSDRMCESGLTHATSPE